MLKKYVANEFNQSRAVCYNLLKLCRQLAAFHSMFVVFILQFNVLVLSSSDQIADRRCLRRSVCHSVHEMVV